jgi:CDGSH-type Zn-finger protein
MPTKVTIRNDKSIWVEGEFSLVDETGAQFDLAGRTKISLCRCGHSADKPFCDGSHNQANFKSLVKARALPPPAPKP